MRRTAGLVLALVLVLAGCAPVPVPRSSVYHPSDAALGVTRVVHGTFVLELAKTRLLLDPWFHSGFIVRQREPLGLTPKTLPVVGAVLISSLDPERFDTAALRDLAATTPRAIAPPALRPHLLRAGFRDVTPLAWWQTTTIDAVTVTAVPTSRGAAVNGWVVSTDAVRCWIAGPTGPFPRMADIAAKFPQLDVAILPIAGEMTPSEAAAVAARLRPARVIPSDYGAQGRLPFLGNSAGALDRFRAAMAKRGLADRVVAIETGESWHYGSP